MKSYQTASETGGLLTPHVRSSLILYLRDVATWNNEFSRIRTTGADDIIDFFFEELDLSEHVGQQVGRFLYGDEVGPVEKFMGNFSRFLDDISERDGNLQHVHEAKAPDDLVICASKLRQRLIKRPL